MEDEFVPFSWTPTPRGDILKFDANVDVDSRMNWSEHEGLEGIWLVFADIELNISVKKLSVSPLFSSFKKNSPEVKAEQTRGGNSRLRYAGADLTFTIKTQGSFNFCLLMNQLFKGRCVGFRGRNGIRYS